MTVEHLGEELTPATAPSPVAMSGAIESSYLTPSQVQAFLRLVESAPDVHRRSQFYVWMQSHLQVLLPHELAVCGAYSRQRRQLEFEIFNTVPLPAPLLDSLAGTRSTLMAEVARAWVEGDCRACAWVLGGLTASGAGIDGDALYRAGLTHIAVHGVSRPERPHEVESLFMLCARAGTSLVALLPTFELLMPQIHTTYVRSRGVERDLAHHSLRAATTATDRKAEKVTAREAQILESVREGKSNREIGEALGISGLTVKNHVQKILKKLDASNRAQAVAIAIQSRLITASATQEPSAAAKAGDGT